MGKKLLQKAGAIGLPPVGSTLSGADGTVPGSPGPAGLAGDVVAKDGAGARPGGASTTQVPGATQGLGTGGAQGGDGALLRTTEAGRLSGHAVGAIATGPGLSARAKTAPGTMLGFMTAQSAAVHEAEQLRQRLSSFEGAQPARRLDPTLIRPSRWANRHARAYDDVAFAALRAEIAAAGGNVQAIKVRPLVAGSANADAGQGVGRSNPLAAAEVARFEIVFGHRRHRACLELGLPVLAVVEEVSDQQLFVEMERENRQRKDLSAWEQGTMYARALDQGLYPSNRQLALAIGRDLGDVGKALALARLPQPVVEAFASPLELQFRWASLLSQALQQDPEGLLARAQQVRALAPRPAAKRVLELLLGAAPKGVGRSNPPPGHTWQRDGRTLATWAVDARGRTHLSIEAPLDEAAQRKLRKLLDSWFG